MPIPKDGTLLSSQEVVFDSALLKTLHEKGVPGEQVQEMNEMNRRIRVKRITYQSNGHKVNGFLVEPRRRRGKMPCIIWNRGGLGAFSAIKVSTAFRGLGRMADWGYVVIATQYSGNEGSEGADDGGGEETLSDVLNLKKVLEGLPSADTTRIGMYGWSRGGMMTYLSLARVKWIKAAVTVAGLADVERNFRQRDGMREYAEKFWKITRKGMAERSAVCWPEKFSKKVPILLMHGTADWRVSPQDSLDLASKLYEQKVPYRLVMFEGDDHGVTEHAKERYQLTREWFDRFVKNDGPLPNLKLHGP